MLQVVSSQSAMARVKAGSRQIQVRFERLPQEVGALRPMGMQFCWSQDVLAEVIAFEIKINPAYSTWRPIGEICWVTIDIGGLDSDN